MIRIKTDAAVNDTKKTAGIGIVIISENMYEQLAIPIPYDQVHNNHTLEFEAFLSALRWLIKENITDEMIFIETDSQVVVQVIENEQTKNNLYQPFIDEYIRLKEYFSIITLQWIPERENKGADNLAKQALMKKLT